MISFIIFENSSNEKINKQAVTLKVWSVKSTVDIACKDNDIGNFKKIPILFPEFAAAIGRGARSDPIIDGVPRSSHRAGGGGG